MTSPLLKFCSSPSKFLLNYHLYTSEKGNSPTIDTVSKPTLNRDSSQKRKDTNIWGTGVTPLGSFGFGMYAKSKIAVSIIFFNVAKVLLRRKVSTHRNITFPPFCQFWETSPWSQYGYFAQFTVLQ